MKEQDLPKSVSAFGTTKEEIFVTYETLKAEYGDEADKFPMGALGIYTYSDKIKVGLQQLMSGSRNMRLDTIGRCDLMALTRDVGRDLRHSVRHGCVSRRGDADHRGLDHRLTSVRSEGGAGSAPPLRFRGVSLAPARVLYSPNQHNGVLNRR